MSSPFVADYGVATDFYLPIIKVSTNNFAVSGDWTPAAGDVKVSIDGGAAANVGTLPTAITMGNGAMWKFPLSAAELAGKRVTVTVVDAATKAVEDQMVVIATRDHPSAAHPNGVTRRATAQGGAAQAITLDASASATDDAYNGALLEVRSGTGAGQVRLVADYTGSSKVAVVDRPWITQPDNTSVFLLYAASLPTTKEEIQNGLALEATLGTPAGASIAADIAATAAQVLGSSYEGTETVQQFLRLIRAVLVGKSTGGGKVFRDLADTKDRVTGTTDGSGNRTAVAVDAS